ncbi:hypothetical protein [Flexivirga oryzae]|uniref:Uncharacterized protein n=1 Tax=Flexivirga oryzae TaxID=1794944 RepID=A0A839N3V0_9MICO|nr:hypothetical protein [Flexivirga oryzae]MBB2890643.1 hypothetical protein [Flexivirga oryzae]
MIERLRSHPTIGWLIAAGLSIIVFLNNVGGAVGGIQTLLNGYNKVQSALHPKKPGTVHVAAIPDTNTASNARAKPKSTTASGPSSLQVVEWPGGWGPERKTYTLEKPAGKPVLNSIDATKQNGLDERHFVYGKRSNQGNDSMTYNLQACPGDKVDLWAAVANDAASNIKAGDVEGLTARIVTGTAGNKPGLNVGVVLSSYNAGSVWSSMSVDCGKTPLKASLLAGTAHLVTKDTPKGGLPIALSNKVDTALLGSGLVANGQFSNSDSQWYGTLRLTLEIQRR